MPFTALRKTCLGSPRIVRQMCHSSQHRLASFSTYMVSPEELRSALTKNAPSSLSTSPRTIPICAAWFMPNDSDGRTGVESFKKKRIPGARFFDIDDIKDHDSPYPHMLPTCEAFAESMQKLGIRKDDDLVVYDTEDIGIFSAPRVGWLLRVYGHPNVHVLNNFRLWCKGGLSTTSGGVEAVESSKYAIPSYQTGMVVKFAEMKTIGYDYGKEGAEEIQILDARSKGRWEGTQPEPRPGLRSGHMPGSISIPFEELLHPESRALLPAEELRQVFASRQVDPQKPIIASCGTGVTAAVIEAALQQADFGKPYDRRIYDGSWTEWATRVSESSGLIRKFKPQQSSRTAT